MLLIGILFLMLQTFLSFFRPKWFVFTYVLFVSSFLGFFPKVILLGGKDIGLFYQTLLMLSHYFIFYKRTYTLPKSFRNFLNISILIYLYGVFSPVINGTSSLSLSVIASKHFSSIFLIHYLFIHSTSITYKHLNKILNFFGYYFILFLLTYIIIKISPPYYIKDDENIQYFYPTILSLFLFIKSYQSHSISQKIFTLILLIIWAKGMQYDGHFAITITTLLSCSIILFRIPVIYFLQNHIKLLIGSFMFISLLLVFPSEQYLSTFKKDKAILSREKINQERYKLIEQKPLIGYGFLHRNAFELEEVNSRYSKELSFIDSGYVDLLGKFGGIGTFIYLFFFFRVFFYRSTRSLKSRAFKLFFLQLIIVNITWSVFSFNLGLTALSFAVILIYFSDYKTLSNDITES